MEQSYTYYFEKTSVPKAIAYMAVPFILAMSINVVYGIADNIFIGQLNDPDKVAVAILAMPVLALFMGLANIFGIGCGSYISRLLGEQKIDEAKSVSAFAFWATGCLALLSTALVLVLMNPVLTILGTTAATRADTQGFITVLTGGATIIMLNFCMGQIVRSEGASRESMIGILVGTGLNIVLDPIFILVFHLGVEGAALANVLANGLSVVYYLWYFLRKSQNLSILPRDIHITALMLKESLAIGMPVFFSGLLLMVSSLCLNNFAALHGDLVVAILGIAIQVNMIPQFLISGLCEGIQPLLGYNFAAGNKQRMNQIIRFASWVSLALGIGLSALLFLFSRSVLGLFLHDETVIAQGIPLFRIAMLAQATYGGIYLSISVFQAAGKAVPAFVMSLAQGLIFIPVLIFGNLWFGVWGVAAALPISEFATAVLGVALYLAIRKGLQATSTSAPVVVGDLTGQVAA